jgi:hypothetical protein
LASKTSSYPVLLSFINGTTNLRTFNNKILTGDEGVISTVIIAIGTVIAVICVSFVVYQIINILKAIKQLKKKKNKE